MVVLMWNFFLMPQMSDWVELWICQSTRCMHQHIQSSARTELLERRYDGIGDKHVWMACVCCFEVLKLYFSSHRYQISLSFGYVRAQGWEHIVWKHWQMNMPWMVQVTFVLTWLDIILPHSPIKSYSRYDFVVCVIGTILLYERNAFLAHTTKSYRGRIQQNLTKCKLFYALSVRQKLLSTV